MGLGIGGIAAAITPKTYAWNGDLTRAVAGTTTQDITLSGLNPTDTLKVVIVGYVSQRNNPAQTQNITLTAYDGAAKTVLITYNLTPQWFIITAFIKNGHQSFVLNNDTTNVGLYQNTAITMASVSYLRVSYSPDPAGGDNITHLYGVSVERLIEST